MMSDKLAYVCGLCVWACNAKQDPVAFVTKMNVSVIFAPSFETT